MTEKTEMKVIKELGTSSWSFVGMTDDEQSKVYQTARGDLFAVNNESEKVSFDVYEEDGEFIAY